MGIAINAAIAVIAIGNQGSCFPFSGDLNGDGLPVVIDIHIELDRALPAWRESCEFLREGRPRMAILPPATTNPKPSSPVSTRVLRLVRSSDSLLWLPRFSS